MKKILMIGVLISALTLTSCNPNVDSGSRKIHIPTCGGEPTHFKIKSGMVYEGGYLVLKVENYGEIKIGSGTYMIYDTEDCPICGKVEYK